MITCSHRELRKLDDPFEGTSMNELGRDNQSGNLGEVKENTRWERREARGEHTRSRHRDFRSSPSGRHVAYTRTESQSFVMPVPLLASNLTPSIRALHHARKAKDWLLAPASTMPTSSTTTSSSSSSLLIRPRPLSLVQLLPSKPSISNSQVARHSLVYHC